MPDLSDEEIEEYIETLETHFSDRLSVWETEFLENVSEQWEARRFLTQGQRDKLNEIMEKYSRKFGGTHHG